MHFVALAVITLYLCLQQLVAQYLPCDHLLAETVASVLSSGSPVFGMHTLLDVARLKQPSPCPDLLGNSGYSGLSPSTADEVRHALSLVTNNAARGAAARGIYKFLRMTTSPREEVRTFAYSECERSSDQPHRIQSLHKLLNWLEYVGHNLEHT